MLDLNYALPDFTAGLKMNLSLIESWRNDPAMFRTPRKLNERFRFRMQ